VSVENGKGKIENRQRGFALVMILAVEVLRRGRHSSDDKFLFGGFCGSVGGRVYDVKAAVSRRSAKATQGSRTCLR
jgi:hypothetical protein